MTLSLHEAFYQFVLFNIIVSLSHRRVLVDLSHRSCWELISLRNFVACLCRFRSVSVGLALSVLAVLSRRALIITFLV